MTKKFILEQCNRARAAIMEEMREFEKTWWENHLNGHLKMIDIIIDYINQRENMTIDRDKFRKFLKKQKRKAMTIANDIYEKIESVTEPYEIAEKDYFIHDGMECQAKTFLDIVNKKFCYSKN